MLFGIGYHPVGSMVLYNHLYPEQGRDAKNSRDYYFCLVFHIFTSFLFATVARRQEVNEKDFWVSIGGCYAVRKNSVLMEFFA